MIKEIENKVVQIGDTFYNVKELIKEKNTSFKFRCEGAVRIKDGIPEFINAEYFYLKDKLLNNTITIHD